MKVELRNIPQAEDKDKDILVNGVHVGTVCRGWLRDGGAQWVVYSHILGSTFGAKTLRQVKQKVEYKIRTTPPFVGVKA